MNYILCFLLSCNVVLLALLVFNIRKIEINTFNASNNLLGINHSLNSIYGIDEYIDEFDSGINPEIEKRDKLFEERIENIKKEIYGQTSMFDEESNGDILDEAIYNIPHHVVDNSIYDELEVAD